MKKMTLSLGSAFLSLSLAAVTVSDVTVRQDWPWSSRIDVSYQLSDVTRATSILVELYDGTTKIGMVMPSGDWMALGADGTYALSFDPADVPAIRQLAVSNFKVKLVPQAADPSWDFPLYKDINLETGTVTDITPAQIVSGTLGTWKWAEERAAKVTDDGGVAYTNLIWTGVAAEGSVYKTSHLVLRYLAAKGDLAYICQNTPITMPQDLYFAVFETTQGQWAQVGGPTLNCAAKGDTLPVENVKFDNIRGAKGTEAGTEAQYLWPNAPDPDSFLGKLRAKCGLTALDLPAAFEWTYAVMAKSLYCTGSLPPPGWNDNVSWDDRTVPPGRRQQTGEVGLYADPSMQGLYDMHGNVWELCLDYAFGTQLEFKNLKTSVNVNLENPTQNAAGEEKSAHAIIGGGYSTPKSGSPCLTLNTQATRSLAASSTSGEIGFRVCMPAEIDEQTVTPLADATPGESASVFVYAKPRESFLWRTAPGTTFTVSWTLPAGATKATLSVAGHGYSQEYVDLTATSQELTLPSENVYTLTLTPDEGEAKTAQLAVVRGGVTGGTATIAYAPEGTKKWQAAANWNVLPLLCGATTLQVGETSIPCDGAAGWYGLDLSAAEGATTVRLTVGADEYENALVLPNGLLLLFR